MQKSIDKVMTKAREQVKEFLMEAFPNIYFYISPTGDISCWVRTLDGTNGGTAITLKYNINVGQILTHEWNYLKELDALVKLCRTEDRKFFYCTECGKVKPREEYGDWVMAATYCKECAEIPEIAALIKESKKAGFYD